MGPYGTLIYLGVLAALFYFLFIRPQAARQREQAALLSSLSEGDRVVTAGGIYGTIREVTGEVVRLEIADGVVVDLARPAIGKRLDITAPQAGSTTAIDAGEMPEERPSDSQE